MQRFSFNYFFFFITDATPVMEPLPKKNEEKINHHENYHFYGFDNSIDETSKYSCNNTNSSGNVKSRSGSYLFDSQMGALKNTVKADTDPKLEANLKTL